MKNKTFGFIGCGNMGGALAAAVSRVVDSSHIYICGKSARRAEALSKSLGCSVLPKEDIARKCDFIFLGVKPQMMAEMLSEISPVLAERTERFVLVSMAGGLSMERILQMAGGSYPLIRIMPNTPVAVGCGIIQYDCTENVNCEELEVFRNCLSEGGMLDRLPEKLIDAGSALAGSGPAFADMFIEALSDGAVACGLPRDKAMAYAAQMLIGSARLLLESGKHPGELKDAVCSPGGSTIAGVRALEQRGFRAACMEAVESTYRRNIEMGK